MANERPSLKIITPRGVAIYPKLDKPDFKFDDAGVYEAKLNIAADASDGLVGRDTVTTAELVECLENLRDEFVEEKRAELAASRDPKNKKRASAISVKSIGEPALDDDGEETGGLILKAKMKASGISAKDGKPWERKPALFDAKGKPLPKNSKPIYGGSTLKLAAKAVPYYIPKDNEVGVTLYLEAVQVIDLVSGGGRTASAYGFGAEEGYEGEEDDASGTFDDTTGGTESDDVDF